MPVIGTLQSFRDHLHSGEGVHIVFVEPKANTRQPSLDLLSQGPPPDRATLTIGPEGGWSDEELDHARAAGCKLLTVGTRTLRADATPVAVLSVVLYLWGEL